MYIEQFVFSLNSKQPFSWTRKTVNCSVARLEIPSAGTSH